MNIFQQLAAQDRPKFIAARNRFQKESRTFPKDDFIAIPKEDIDGLTSHGRKPISAWRSQTFFVMAFEEKCGSGNFMRLSVNRTQLNNDGGWKDGITWDELMEIKRMIGFGEQWMCEVYPADSQTVNVANIRHLFLTSKPAFAWSDDRLPVAKPSVTTKMLNFFKKGK